MKVKTPVVKVIFPPSYEYASTYQYFTYYQIVVQKSTKLNSFRLESWIALPWQQWRNEQPGKAKPFDCNRCFWNKISSTVNYDSNTWYACAIASTYFWIYKKRWCIYLRDFRVYILKIIFFSVFSSWNEIISIKMQHSCQKFFFSNQINRIRNGIFYLCKYFFSM